jgi:hypothetical protein
MRHRLFLLLATLLAAPLHALDLPLSPAEKAVIEQIASLEAIELVLAATPGWSAKGAEETLVGLGLPKDEVASVTVHAQGEERRAVTLTHDKAGHVLAITGNGPRLRNDGLRLLTGLPELRMIRIDHNGHAGSDPRSALYDGSGFAALADSKLAVIKIGLSFTDKGMEQCAKIKTLKTFFVSHSQVTEAGIAFFAGHPGPGPHGVLHRRNGRPASHRKGARDHRPHPPSHLRRFPGVLRHLCRRLRPPRALQGQAHRDQSQHGHRQRR